MWNLHFKRNKSSLHLLAIAIFVRGEYHAWHGPRVWNHKGRAHVHREDEEINPSMGFGKTSEFRGVVAPRNAGHQGSHETGPQKIRTKMSGGTAAILQPFSAVDLALNTTIREGSPAGRLDTSHFGGGWQVGNIVNFFFGLGSRKASGLSCSG